MFKNLLRFVVAIIMVPFFIIVLLPFICLMEYIEESGPEDQETSKEMRREVFDLSWRWLTFKGKP